MTRSCLTARGCAGTPPDRVQLFDCQFDTLCAANCERIIGECASDPRSMPGLPARLEQLGRLVAELVSLINKLASRASALLSRSCVVGDAAQGDRRQCVVLCDG